jgi:hypothetical protein
MERYCSTGQSPQRSVAPTEEEEEEELDDYADYDGDGDNYEMTGFQ